MNSCTHKHLDLETAISAPELTVVCTDCDQRVALHSPDFDSAWFEVLSPAARARVEDYGARVAA